MKEEWQVCEPLRELPSDIPIQEQLYENWKKIKGE
jgi:hypothetical protein